MRALLALEDGKIFEGKSFGVQGERCGEVIFNTSMMGYQEILTDPSYQGQIVVMTYPLIGKVKASPGLIGKDLVVEVSSPAEYFWKQKNGNHNHHKKYKVIAYDYGIKYNILR